ncbi:MAG TPA: hypothetical protein VFU64_01185 [Gaiellaceae bacterium]|nr:hypothetical protein [Gaiellaceae bacterium]
MKRFLMLVAVAAVAGVMYVAAAPGGRQSTPTAQQFAALKKRVARLSKSLTVLKKDEARVKSGAAQAEAFLLQCFVSAGAVGVSQFGDANGTFGFGYQATPPPSAGTITSYRRALDIDTSSAAQGLLQAVSPACITSDAAENPHLRSSSSQLPAHGERAR